MIRRPGAVLAAVASLSVAVALSLAACGGEAGEASDLARFAPSDSLFFADLAVRPEGELKESIEAVLARFPGGERVGEMLVAEIDESLREEGFSYEREIEPWLGERAAIWGAGARFKADGGLEVPDQRFAAALETTDEDQALGTLRAAAEREGRVSDADYNGVEYFTAATDERGDGPPAAAGAVDGAIVLAGSEREFRAAVDAVGDDDALEGTDDWGELISDAGADTMLLAYLDLKPLLELADRSTHVPDRDAEAGRRLLGSFAEEPILLSVEIEESKGVLELSTAEIGVDEEALEQSSLLADVPGDAWLGFGLSDVGDYVDTFVRRAEDAGSAHLDPARLNRRLRREIGIDLSDLSGLGDAAVFIAGRSLFELQVGAVVESTDEAQRDRLLAAVRRAAGRSDDASIGDLGVDDAEGFSVIVRGLPVRINFAAADDRLVVAGGDTATEGLLEGDGDTGALDRAGDVLGDDFTVNLFVEIAPILALAEAAGAGEDPGFAEAKPYLEQFDTVAIGSKREDGRDLQRIVVELE